MSFEAESCALDPFTGGWKRLSKRIVFERDNHRLPSDASNSRDTAEGTFKIFSAVGNPADRSPL